MTLSLKRTTKAVAFLLLSIILTACGNGDDISATNNTDYSPENPVDVKIGVIGDPTSPTNVQWEIVIDDLADEGINIELVSFSDYTTPNTALAQWDLDLNATQTKIYVGTFNESYDANLASFGDTTFNPLGIFSNQYNDISEIQEGDQIAIPNNATNEGRSLILLQTAGLIEVDSVAELNPTLDDITANPLNLDIVLVDPNQTARSLQDSDVAIINNDMAQDAGLIPSEDAIYLEEVSGETEPYINAIVGRSEDLENPVYKRIVDAYQSDAVAEKITEVTKGSSIPAWTENN